MGNRSLLAQLVIGLLSCSFICASASAENLLDTVSCESGVLSQEIQSAVARVDPGFFKQYESTTPLTVSVCAGSRESDMQDQSANPFGHVALFLKGVCRNPNAAVPQLKICQNADPSDPNQGVGVSVDDDFKNVNWVAVDGKQMFLYGETPDADHIHRVSAKALMKAESYYKGIELTPEAMAKKPPGESTAYYAATYGAGTDFALNRAREDVDCGEIPVTKASMVQLIAYLNGINQHYARSRDYSYSIATNNCAHLVRRALVAGGIFPRSDLAWDSGSSAVATVSQAVKALPVGIAVLAVQKYKNGAAPEDELLRLIKRDNAAMPLTPEQIYNDPALRQRFNEDMSIPIEMPVTYKSFRRAAGLNDLSHLGDKGVDSPDPVFTTQQAKLADYDFIGKMERARNHFLQMGQNRAAAEAYASKTSNPEAYGDFLRNYYHWVDSSIRTLNTKIALAKSANDQLYANMQNVPDPALVCEKNPAKPMNTTTYMKNLDPFYPPGTIVKNPYSAGTLSR